MPAGAARRHHGVVPSDPTAVTAVDLRATAASADELASTRAWWVEGSDLAADLVVLRPGQVLEGHVNRDGDLILLGVSGEASLDTDPGPGVRLEPHVLVHVPAGAWRKVTAGNGGASFVSVHRPVVRSRRLRAARREG